MPDARGWVGSYSNEIDQGRALSPRTIEELSLNAWPALQTILYDGWLLCFSRGYTRRANSVNPIYSSRLPLDEKIRFCEQVYAAAGERVVFKLSSATQPSDLEAALEAHGYQREGGTSVQFIELPPTGSAGVPPAVPRPGGRDDRASGRPDDLIVLTARVEPSWIADFCRLNAIPERHVATMTAMLESIAPATAFATYRRSGEALAVGLAVAERNYVGLFDIVTAPAARNQGIGSRLVSHLLQWGRDGGATRGYLQVVDGNLPALNLYAKLGFREIYQYWYRVR